MIKFQNLPSQKQQAIRDEVLRFYAETELSYGELWRDWGSKRSSVTCGWIIVRNFTSPDHEKEEKDTSEDDYDRFRAEVTRLRKEIRQDKMQAEVLVTMIDVAKDVFNIPVRIKAVTK